MPFEPVSVPEVDDVILDRGVSMSTNPIVVEPPIFSPVRRTHRAHVVIAIGVDDTVLDRGGRIITATSFHLEPTLAWPRPRQPEEV